MSFIVLWTVDQFFGRTLNERVIDMRTDKKDIDCSLTSAALMATQHQRSLWWFSWSFRRTRSPSTLSANECWGLNPNMRCGPEYLWISSLIAMSKLAFSPESEPPVNEYLFPTYPLLFDPSMKITFESNHSLTEVRAKTGWRPASPSTVTVFVCR